MEKFDSYATFIIESTPIKCATDKLLTIPDDENQEFFSNIFPIAVPISSPNRYYTEDQIPDFFDVLGENTGYTITTEECIADNFSFAIVKGIDGINYANPELIQGILDILA